jgi:hypothetical protein
MASLNSRAGVYERLPPSSSRGEDTSRYSNTVRFTSVGIPVAADDTVSMIGTAVKVRDDAKPVRHRLHKIEKRIADKYLQDKEEVFKIKTGHFHAGIPMINRGTAF